MSLHIRETALILVMAGQSILVPVARISCDFVRPVTAMLQRVSNALPTSPRWGYSLDRLGTSAELRAVLHPGSLT